MTLLDSNIVINATHSLHEPMGLKPWREIAHPHKNVLEGTFKQSEFARQRQE